MESQWDLRAASFRNLVARLRDFLDERGYVHEYELLKAEVDSTTGVTVFKCRLVGKREIPKRDLPYLVFGFLLLPTIVLTSLGIRFVRESRYSLRTVVNITVEGEGHIANRAAQVSMQSELPDMVMSASVALDVRAGAALGDYEIVRPTEDKHEMMKTAEEQRDLENGLSELLSTIALREEEVSQEP